MLRKQLRDLYREETRYECLRSPRRLVDASVWLHEAQHPLHRISPPEHDDTRYFHGNEVNVRIEITMSLTYGSGFME
jgi:hypothetical protein